VSGVVDAEVDVEMYAKDDAPSVEMKHGHEGVPTDPHEGVRATQEYVPTVQHEDEDVTQGDEAPAVLREDGQTEEVDEGVALEGDETGQADEPTDQADGFPVDFPLVAALESLLFVSDEAVEPRQLARALGIAPAEAEAGLQALDAAYREGGRGLRLQTRNGRYQLVTAPEAANLIETFLNLDTSTKLSAPALETLAVAAYRQPVTRAQIEAVRGVDCSGVLRSLLQRGLLEEVGRLDAPGRPVLYGVTDLFMHHFGLTALHELPPLESTELARIEEAIDQKL
jgi:segregation and condensation protein B